MQVRRAMPRGRALWLLPLLAAGCQQYQPYDSRIDLREQFQRRVPPELVDQVEIPYDLSPEILAEVERFVNPSANEGRRTEQIVDYIFSALDLRYALVPTRTAEETFHTREGNCLSFVNLFVGIARQQRLNPFYVEVEDYQRWNYSDGVVVSRGHIVAGMNVDGELSTFDFLPYRPKGYRDFNPIDDITAMAHYYNNLGAEALMNGDIDAAEPNLVIANALAPDFVKAINNLGIVHLRRGRIERAIELYERSLELHPDSVPLLNNLARAYQEEGRAELALGLLDRIDSVNQANPFIYIYRGEQALANGDAPKALEFMRQALRTDSEVPEVHIGLAKVFIALGNLDRARHHVERALKLDATNVEARKYAALLDPAGG